MDAVRPAAAWHGAFGTHRGTKLPLDLRLGRPADNYFHVTSIPKKCMKTSRFGLFFGFCCGLRM
jgi:hypothetical protein